MICTDILVDLSPAGGYIAIASSHGHVRVCKSLWIYRLAHLYLFYLPSFILTFLPSFSPFYFWLLISALNTQGGTRPCSHSNARTGCTIDGIFVCYIGCCWCMYKFLQYYLISNRPWRLL